MEVTSVYGRQRIQENHYILHVFSLFIEYFPRQEKTGTFPPQSPYNIKDTMTKRLDLMYL